MSRSPGSLYIGVDVSTSAAKALVYDGSDSNQIVARGEHLFKPLQSDPEHPGRAEQDPAEWIAGVKHAVRQALQQCDATCVSGIAVSGQQHGFVPLDEHFQVIRPAKLWCDVESAEEARELSAKFGYELVPGFTASKILWLKRREPEHFARLRHVLLPHDYINFYLTGRLVMECGDASGTGVFDLHRRMFRWEHMREIDEQLHTCFPELIGPQEVVGNLTEAAAEDLGLSTSVIVAPGTGDNAASAMGSGAVSSGVWVVSLGTSGTLFGHSRVPIWEPPGLAPFCDATGRWLPLLCTMNCTGVANEVCRSFGMTHGQLTELAAKEPAGCEGVNFLPYLTGERTPSWPHARGALLGLGPGSLRPGLLYRAALEGATFSLFAGMALLRQHGAAATQLRLVGGGSKNALWRQIVADIFQLPVVLPLEPESAALGVAMQAAAVHRGVPVADFITAAQPPIAEQVVEPNKAHSAVYKEAFNRHQALGRRLFQQEQ